MGVYERVKQVTSMIRVLEEQIGEERILEVETQKALNDLFSATNALFTVSMSRGYIPNDPLDQPPPGPPTGFVGPTSGSLPSSPSTPLTGPTPGSVSTSRTTSILCPNPSCGYNIKITLS